MKETDNLKLVKPDYAEDADIAVINENMDVIDEAVNANEKLIAELTAKLYALEHKRWTHGELAGISKEE